MRVLKIHTRSIPICISYNYRFDQVFGCICKSRNSHDNPRSPFKDKEENYSTIITCVVGKLPF